MTKTALFPGSSRRIRDIWIVLWYGTVVPLSISCGSSSDSGSCPQGQVLRYETPGCAAAAKPVCGSPTQDACYRAVCSCKGETISRCDYAPEPFAAFGACPLSDGGIPDSGSVSQPDLSSVSPETMPDLPLASPDLSSGEPGATLDAATEDLGVTSDAPTEDLGVTSDGGTCPTGQVLRYETPGCGTAASPVCGSPTQDACYRAVCSCKGETISRCDYAPEPFAAFGACPGSDGAAAPVRPADEQSCVKATQVPVCDLSSPYATITPVAGGPLLAKVEVTSGSCTGLVCPSGCTVAGVLGWPSMVAGATCDFLVTSTDGRSQSLTLAAVANPSASYMCCGSPADGRGVWTAVNGLLFSPSSVVVDFASDGGAATQDLGRELPANPCAGCAADEVCTQSFDGTCQLGTVTCRPVSETCRSKLTASGAKSCKSIPECESELCSSPFRCVYDPPCGTEAPEATLYCYGP